MHGEQPLPQQASKSGAGGGTGMGSTLGAGGGVMGVIAMNCAGEQNPPMLFTTLPGSDHPVVMLRTSCHPLRRDARQPLCLPNAPKPSITPLQHHQEGNVIIVTTENLAGHRVDEVKGQVFGVVVRSRGLAGNILAGLRSIVGGEITEYTQLLEEARRHAVDRMVKNASLMGANAVVMMRFDSSEMGQTMSEIVAYGTAVVVEKLPA